MEIGFGFILNRKKYDLQVYYSLRDETFGCSPIGGDCSIMIEKNYTSLEYSSISNTVCGISGYNPRCDWIIQKTDFPDAKSGCLIAMINGKVPVGTSITYTRSWRTFFDPETKVICFKDPQYIKEDSTEMIEFAEGMVACFSRQELVAIYVCPRIIH